MKKKIDLFPLPLLFYFKCECKALSIREVAFSGPLGLPVGAFCLAFPCSLEGDGVLHPRGIVTLEEWALLRAEAAAWGTSGPVR